MKKFTWSLQRLLDVKHKQEDAVRSELVALTEQAAGMRGRVMMLEMMLRTMLSELKEHEPAQRMIRQAEFMEHVHIKDAEIRRAKQELETIEQQRRQKIDELMKFRKFRKGLERLRTKAKTEYMVQMHRDEQNQLDENTSVVFAKKILTAGIQ